MKFQALASSSHGNAYIINDGVTRILIECGLSFKRLQQLSGFQLADVSACFISHEHKDHAGCYWDLLKNGMPVFSSAGTAAALDCNQITVLEERETAVIGTLEVMPFQVFHDAAEPYGFLVRSSKDGDKLAFATDTVNLQYRFPGVTILAVECNYARPILERCTRMPEKVRRRIENSHMEVDRLCTWLATLPLDDCREIYLLHLSDACSDEEQFTCRVRRSVPTRIKVIPCPKIIQEGC